MAVGKNISQNKGKGKYHLPVILWLLARISRGEGDGSCREEKKDVNKMEVGKNIKSYGTLYTLGPGEGDGRAP